ncbi:MAG TPA: hypothetical protein VLF21_00740 [Candidatus Saccharimonadales bacterium]|nr:hypothetical protein [Candidatus Saccharimonadales bacterium]
MAGLVLALLVSACGSSDRQTAAQPAQAPTTASGCVSIQVDDTIYCVQRSKVAEFRRDIPFLDSCKKAKPLGSSATGFDVGSLPRHCRIAAVSGSETITRLSAKKCSRLVTQVREGKRPKPWPRGCTWWAATHGPAFQSPQDVPASVKEAPGS